MALLRVELCHPKIDIGKGNGNPLQYSRLENLMDRGVCQATVHGVTKVSDTSQQLNKTITMTEFGLPA